MTLRLPVTLVPEPRIDAPTGALLGMADSIRVVNQNFRLIQNLLERSVVGGSLLAPGSVTELHLSTDAKTLAGDVTGTTGASGSTTVEKIRGAGVDAPGASEDAKALAYNHGNLDFDWVDVLRDVLTTRGDLLYRGASAESRLAIGAANTLLKSDGTDPGWGTLTALLDAVFSSTQGSVLYRDAAAWAALAPGTSGHFLQTQGGGANPQWASASSGSTFLGLSDTPASFSGQANLYVRVNAGETALEFASVAGGSSPLTTKGDLYTYSTMDARLGVGTDNYMLTPDAAQTTGLKWASLSSMLDAVFSSTQGSILYRGASAWAALGPGTDGQVLTTGGSGANPAWEDAPGGTLDWWDKPWNYQVVVLYAARNAWTKIGGAQSLTENTTASDYTTSDMTRRCRRMSAVAGTICGWRSSGVASTTGAGYYGHSMGLACDGYLESSLTNNQWFIGFPDNLNPSTANNGGFTEGAFIRYLNGTDTNFQLVTMTGGTATTTDTGVAAAADTWYDFRIWSPDGGTTWYASINGSTPVSSTSNVPSTTTIASASMVCFYNTTGTTTRVLRYGYANVYSNLQANY